LQKYPQIIRVAETRSKDRQATPGQGPLFLFSVYTRDTCGREREEKLDAPSRDKLGIRTPCRLNAELLEKKKTEKKTASGGTR
jgi:hypothetical protein